MLHNCSLGHVELFKAFRLFTEVKQRFARLTRMGVIVPDIITA